MEEDGGICGLCSSRQKRRPRWSGWTNGQFVTIGTTRNVALQRSSKNIIFLKDIFFVPGYPDFTRMDGWMLWPATRCQIVLQGAFLVCLLPTQFVFSSFCCCLKWLKRKKAGRETPRWSRPPRTSKLWGGVNGGCRVDNYYKIIKKHIVSWNRPSIVSLF